MKVLEWFLYGNNGNFFIPLKIIFYFLSIDSDAQYLSDVHLQWKNALLLWTKTNVCLLQTTKTTTNSQQGDHDDARKILAFWTNCILYTIEPNHNKFPEKQ